MSAWLVAHRRSIAWLFSLVAVAGALDWFRMPVGLFPVIDFPRIVVSVDAGERPIDRMVTDVTRPIEEAVRAVPHVKTVRSTSSRGTADVSITFAWGADMNNALLLTQTCLDQALPSLPPGTSFVVRRMDPTVFPVVGLSLTSKTRDLVSVRDFATLTLRPILSRISGVANVEVLGGSAAEVHVVADPQRLRAHGIALDDIVATLKEGSVVSGVGRVEDHDKLYLAVADAGLSDLDQVRALVLPPSAPGVVVTIGDVAEVSLGTVPQWTRVTANGSDAVLVNILQQRDGNTLAIAEALQQALKDHAGEVPSGVVVSTYYDQGELVRASATSVRDAILLGALFAAIVLFAFLRNLRATLVVAIILPGVLAATVLVLERLGMSLNVMTLGGMAAAAGLIVDDAVVILEHVSRRMSATGASESAASSERAVVSAFEMWKPLTGSSLATIIVFAPLAFVGGVAGGFFRALALTVAVGLAISYVVALTAVPLLARAFLSSSASTRDHTPNERRWSARIARRYERMLRGLLRRRLSVFLIIVPLAAAGALSYRALGQGFLPSVDEGGFVLDYTAAAGMSLSETDRLVRLVESEIVATDDVDTFSRRTGLQLGGGLTEANTGDFFIHLKPRANRRDIDEVMSDVRARVESRVPGLRIETAQLMEDLIGDLTAVPQPVEVKLYGRDEAALEAAARAVADKLDKIDGLVEVFNGMTIAGDDIVLKVDPVRASLEGLRAQGVAEQASMVVDGEVAADMRVGEKTIGVRVWTPVKTRAHVDDIGRLPIESARAQSPTSIGPLLLPVSRVADVSVEEGRAEIVREDLQHMIAVTARLENRDLASAMSDVKSAVAQTSLPAGVSVAYGGVYAEQQQSFRELALVFVAAVLLVALLLLFLYERFSFVLAILTTTALCAAAVFAGLFLAGSELNLSSLMGLTMIVGIVTEIAIFFFAELAQEGSAQERISEDALVTAGLRRARPILMTSLVAILALLPLALRLGAGAEMQAPLAQAIIAGLLAGVPLVLFLLPVLTAALARSPHTPPQETPLGS
jgi:CzcA family heavy metal efflux pump